MHKRKIVLCAALAVIGVAGFTLHLRALNGGWTILAWNNLGMHCMDSDYSVFSILPPYNIINAQVIDPAGNLVKSPAGITVTYEAIADPDGSGGWPRGAGAGGIPGKGRSGMVGSSPR